MIGLCDLSKVEAAEPEAKKRREEMDDEERRDFDSWLDDIKTKRWEELAQLRFDSYNSYYFLVLFTFHFWPTLRRITQNSELQILQSVDH